MLAVQKIIDAARAEDGVAPFNEATTIALTDGSPLRVNVSAAEYAAFAVGDAPVELVVDPESRRQGHGRALVELLISDGETQFWAHGNLSAAQKLAAAVDLRPQRTLLVLRAELDDRPQFSEIPELTIRGFQTEDTDALVAINAKAFADHPEQGSMDREQFERRSAEEWFDPAGLLIAERDNEVIGFHWTKTELNDAGELIGEVYVVGVDPNAHGGGIGSALTAAGLQYLWDRGVRTVDLYVEGDNHAALAVYHKLGFTQHTIDVLYGPHVESSAEETIEKGQSMEVHPEFTKSWQGTPVDTQDLTTTEAPSSPDEFDVDPPFDTGVGPLPDDRFLDRELSWIAFNARVLELAEDSTLPLLERVRFLSIFGSNLDEFFMVRIAGLKRRIVAGVAVPSASGLKPRDVLSTSLTASYELQQRQAALLVDDILPSLEAEGIHLLVWSDLDDAEKEKLSSFYRDRVFPVLTPLAVDPAHPFPYISGLSLNLALVMRNPKTGKDHFARVKVPPVIDRWIEASPGRFVGLEEVIAAHLYMLFPGMEVVTHHYFRVTRNEDLEVEEDDAENLLKALEQELLRRRFGPPVRLEVEESMSDEVLDLLVSELGMSDDEVFRLSGPLDLRSISEIADLDRPELQFKRFVPGTHEHLAEVETASPADMFSALRKRDVLVHHPYDSFATSVQRFIEQAAADPQVLAIKQTLYRTSGDSPIIDSLVEAARSGKQVLAIVEIKARFDEQANIRWARKLERAGCHVVYGLVGLKTHCKLALVIREEADGLRRYAHIGTGNYNPKTARLYEDLGLLTSNSEITQDLTELFNNLSGFAHPSPYRELLVAPHGIRSGLLDRIDREIENKKSGHDAAIRIKVNSLVDEKLIDKLYEASRAGVSVDLIIRGICALRPDVPGMSENIRVHSVLGRFLEHSRLFWFANAGQPEVWMGSADLMHRNLDRRIEALVRVPSPEHVESLTELLAAMSSEEINSWHLDSSGTWNRHIGDYDIQARLIDRAKSRRSRG